MQEHLGKNVVLSILVMLKFRGISKVYLEPSRTAFSPEKSMAKSGSKYACGFAGTELFNCVQKMTKKISLIDWYPWGDLQKTKMGRIVTINW